MALPSVQWRQARPESTASRLLSMVPRYVKFEPPSKVIQTDHHSGTTRITPFSMLMAFGVL
jgi:hypothetical protein